MIRLFVLFNGTGGDTCPHLRFIWCFSCSFWLLLIFIWARKYWTGENIMIVVWMTCRLRPQTQRIYELCGILWIVVKHRNDGFYISTSSDGVIFVLTRSLSHLLFYFCLQREFRVGSLNWHKSDKIIRNTFPYIDPPPNALISCGLMGNQMQTGFSIATQVPYSITLKIVAPVTRIII